MKRFILSLAIVATSFGAFATQTPAPAKTEKKVEHKAKKEAKAAATVKKGEEKKETAKVVVKTAAPKKG